MPLSTNFIFTVVVCYIGEGDLEKTTDLQQVKVC